jgi:hypothetical protein
MMFEPVTTRLSKYVPHGRMISIFPEGLAAIRGERVEVPGDA